MKFKTGDTVYKEPSIIDTDLDRGDTSDLVLKYKITRQLPNTNRYKAIIINKKYADHTYYEPSIITLPEVKLFSTRKEVIDNVINRKERKIEQLKKHLEILKKVPIDDD
jgi:hypothetical protein